MKMAVIQNVYTVKPSSQLSGYTLLHPFSNWLKDCSDDRPLLYFLFSAWVKSPWSKPWNIPIYVCSSVISVEQWSVFRDVCGYDMEWHSTFYFPFMEWQFCLVSFLDLVVIIKFLCWNLITLLRTSHTGCKPWTIMLTVFLLIRSSFITPEPLKELYHHSYDFYYDIK